jgi:hypothetical protein
LRSSQKEQTMDEVEEVILALRAAGVSIPQYKILPDGSYYFYYGQENTDIGIHSEEPRSYVS